MSSGFCEFFPTEPGCPGAEIFEPEDIFDPVIPEPDIDDPIDDPEEPELPIEDDEPP
jgi:hypothetical protein